MIAKEIAWTIGCFDASGGRGLAADIKTMMGLGVHGAGVATAVCAGNTLSSSVAETVSVAALRGQLYSLADDLHPAAVKIGYVDNLAQVDALVEFIEQHKPVFLVYDPDFSRLEGESSFRGQTGQAAVEGETAALPPLLRGIKERLLPLCHLLTLDLQDALTLLGLTAEACPAGDDRGLLDAFIEELGLKLVALGPKSVLLKGGDRKGSFSQDYFTNGLTGLWLTSLKRTSQSTLGTGDTLSSAITAGVALGHGILDGLIIAKSYLNQTLDQAPHIGRGNGPTGHGNWTCDQSTLPWLTLSGEEGRHRLSFRPANNMGFYPIVDSFAMVETMVNAGVKHIQLRIKELSGEALSEEIRESARLCRQAGAELFVNDYADLAIKHGAHGVHLGQADLVMQDLSRVAEAGLKLGVTALSYWEVARALALKPSYITVGPIFFDDAPEREAHQGLSALLRWRKVLDFPLVAAGGIVLANAQSVLATGVDSIAVYRDLSGQADLTLRLEKWLRLFERKGMPSGIDRSFDASVKETGSEPPRIAHDSGLKI
ncbi:MAG: thiamine phosphate synthase [Candidatus Obscuribacter sp.]|nr:thiamine phosphate synthase [Candidatus Obscuribacter sp.]